MDVNRRPTPALRATPPEERNLLRGMEDQNNGTGSQRVTPQSKRASVAQSLGHVCLEACLTISGMG
jgi:hypothetical protein